MYTNAKYYKSPTEPDVIQCINVTYGNIQKSVPINNNNTDYVEIMKLVNAGELTIAEAD